MKMKLTVGLIVSLCLSTATLADGKAVYDKSCSVCHAAAVAGAPKFGDKASWAPRIGKGVDAMLAIVVSGKGAMPPKGTCAICSEGDLKAAVEYMISQVK